MKSCHWLVWWYDPGLWYVCEVMGTRSHEPDFKHSWSSRYEERHITFGKLLNKYLLSEKYRVIQKDRLNFVRLYFLNYTWYVNDLHNI